MNFLTLIPFFKDILFRIIPDKKEAADAVQKMQDSMNALEVERLKAQQVENTAKKDIITTEMNTNTWFSDWRAKLMTMCTLMIGFNWIIVPILNSLLYFIGTSITPRDIPSEAWLLLNVGLGGYIGEKTMATYQQGKVDKAKAENPPNDKAFFDTMGRLFPNGMSQQQVDLMNNALKARDGSNE
jgi:hypothetical protein